MKDINVLIAEELETKPEYVKNVIELMDGGATIPFIARYRKEVHGSMDDTQLRKLEERLTYLRNLEERKESDGWIAGAITRRSAKRSKSRAR